MSLPNPTMDFVPFDVLAASELDELVENIESLAAGTGLNNASVSTVKLTNPCKFYVYRNAAATSAAGTDALIQFDAKLYDTGSNVDVTTNKGRFTAPYAGFYKFDAGVLLGAAITRTFMLLFKNGSVATTLPRGTDIASTSYGVSMSYPLVQLNAGDYIEIHAYVSAATSYSTGVDTFFSGYFVSAT